MGFGKVGTRPPVDGCPSGPTGRWPVVSEQSGWAGRGRPPPSAGGRQPPALCPAQDGHSLEPWEASGRKEGGTPTTPLRTG